jgi:hypothetical protein
MPEPVWVSGHLATGLDDLLAASQEFAARFP